MKNINITNLKRTIEFNMRNSHYGSLTENEINSIERTFMFYDPDIATQITKSGSKIVSDILETV